MRDPKEIVIDATCYLVARRTGDRHWPKLSCRLTKGLPRLEANEVAVRLSISVPNMLFERPALSARIAVPSDSVSQTDISAEVWDNIQEVVQSQLGVDLAIELVEPVDG